MRENEWGGGHAKRGGGGGAGFLRANKKQKKKKKNKKKNRGKRKELEEKLPLRLPRKGCDQAARRMRGRCQKGSKGNSWAIRKRFLQWGRGGCKGKKRRGKRSVLKVKRGKKKLKGKKKSHPSDKKKGGKFS